MRKKEFMKLDIAEKKYKESKLIMDKRIQTQVKRNANVDNFYRSSEKKNERFLSLFT